MSSVAHRESAQSEVARPQVESTRAIPRRGGSCDIRGLEPVGVLLDEGVAVLRESAGRREQQPFMTRRRLEQALHQLATEGHRGGDQFGIVIEGEGGAGASQCVAELVDGELVDRARRAEQGERQGDGQRDGQRVSAERSGHA